MELKSLPVVQSMSNMIPNGSQILSIFPDPLGSYDKLSVVTCPVLIMHSQQDEVVPFAQAQECHKRLTSCKQKTLRCFPNSGHNDVISRHMVRRAPDAAPARPSPLLFLFCRGTPEPCANPAATLDPLDSGARSPL